jgi:hypothetical protein
VTPSIRKVWCIAAAVGASSVAWGGLSWTRAARAERVQMQRLNRLNACVKDLDTLRSKLPDWSANARPSGTLAPQVSAAISAAGLPASAMLSLSADPEMPAPAKGIQANRRRATLVLAPVTLPQLGAFLQTWRQRQPAWVISQLDVSPEPEGKKKDDAAMVGGDLPLRSVMTFETLWLDRGGVR